MFLKEVSNAQQDFIYLIQIRSKQ